MALCFRSTTMNLSGVAVLALAATVTVVTLTLQVVAFTWAVDQYALADPVAPKLRTLSSGVNKSTVFASEIKPWPVVLMHGMGDAAGNSGMKRIRDVVGQQLSTYAVNIQIGNSVEEDVKNSFFITMDEQVEVFAREVRKDEKLREGFNAMGFSQGNLVIRGYIERYNDPPVINFISFHGPLAGVGALPQCRPTQIICKMIDKLIGEAVYSERVQTHLAQSNYFRDPRKIQEYLHHAKFLPDINNEKATTNATYKANFVSLRSLTLVRANKDTQVFPMESEWFGAYEDGDYSRILGFNETRWYKEDLFGLQTLDRAGKVHFLETEGNHLEFTTKFLLEVVDKYFATTLA